MGGVTGGGVGMPADNMQDQLYKNNHLYNLISGLSVNPLLTEVQRAGTLDLSVLEQELEDVEGGWVDLDEEDEQKDDATDLYEQEGIVREMQPTKRSPTALACKINLKKSTLRLVKNFTISNDPSIPAPSHLRPNYRLDFSFDSLTPCDVKLFWVVKEVEEDGDLGLRLRRLHHLPQPTTYHFPAGMNQRFISPILPLYTMSLPELTMQGLPSTSMRLFQKKQQQLRHPYQQQQHSAVKEGAESPGGDDEDQQQQAGGRRKGSHKVGSRSGRTNKKTHNGSSVKTSDSDLHDGKKSAAGTSVSSMGYDEETYKAIMEDQYYPLVILIEATKHYSPSAPVRSLPTPEADSPGLYLVENQAISTFACFNISSEGGFEIKVMKQKVWINSTNYLVQEIYGFTDSVASPAMPKAPKPAATPVSTAPRTKDGQKLSRAMSRLSRAESIASRVTELTADRPTASSKRVRPLSQPAAGDATTTTGACSAAAATNTKRRSLLETVASTFAMKKQPTMEEIGDDGVPGSCDMQQQQDSRHSVVSMSVADLGIAEPDPVVKRDSVAVSRKGSLARQISAEPDDNSAADQTPEDADPEEEEEAEKEIQGEEEAVEPANLVLLDSPECVICLSEIKDTIVLPCRHFCMCSDCGDVLRRRAPQKCPICRQVFQSLLHIASTPTPKAAESSSST
ncbi:hypothetical protein BGZ83_002687 [Gryganskiella cystojenkinii]|nr:hypothetical protein BGZ83_002687 [Gryganskiella cystojenkinii]